MVKLFSKIACQSIKKLIFLPYFPAFLFLCVYAEETKPHACKILYTRIHSKFTCGNFMTVVCKLAPSVFRLRPNTILFVGM